MLYFIDHKLYLVREDRFFHFLKIYFMMLWPVAMTCMYFLSWRIIALQIVDSYAALLLAKYWNLGRIGDAFLVAKCKSN